MATAVLLVVLAVAGPPATAAGPPYLDALILHTPAPGWRTAPQPVSQASADVIGRAETVAVKPLGYTALAAMQAWGNSALQQWLTIALVQLNARSGDPSRLDQVIQPVARSAASILCSGPEESVSTSLSPVPGLPNAFAVVCPPAATGTVRMGMFVTRANIVAMLFVQGSMSTSHLESMAREQYAALPTRDSRPGDTPGGSSATVPIAASVAGVVVLGGAVLMVAWRRWARNEGRGAAG